MNKQNKILLGTAAAAAITGALVYSFTKCNSYRRLKHVANEGYETAHDILYPKRSHKKGKLKFGPVLPFSD